MKKDSRQRIVLFDAHAILHRAYHALPEFATSRGEPSGGLYGLASMLIRIIKDLKPDYLVACYDLPEPTFRKQIYEGYKSTRKKADSELISQIEASKEIFEAFGVPVIAKPGFEADDIIGTLVKKLKSKKDLQIVIASGDMDTMQLIVGDKVVVYTLKKGINDTVVYDEKAVEERYGFKPERVADYKGLRGDPSDNIVGIEGIGEKSATELIQKFGSIEQIYQTLQKSPEKFVEAGIKSRVIELLKNNEEEAEFSKTLATIQQDVPIDYELPEKKWPEVFSFAQAEKTFNHFEFKSLLGRLKQLASGPADLKRPEKIEELPLMDREIEIARWLLDADRTGRIGKVSDDEVKTLIKKEGLEKVYWEIELPLIPIIKKIEERGLLVDQKHLMELSKKHHQQLSEREKKIYQLADQNFNINSPKQLGEILFDKLKLTVKGLKKTAGGARSTRESELEKLRENHPIIEEILAYRELQKVLSTYIDNLPKLIASDGRLHTHLDQTGTATGRMSSSEPNLQNIPVRGEIGREIRNAFIATPGYKLLSLDYSQMEMRVLAVLAKEESLIEVFRSGEDVHTSVAARVFGVKELEVTAEMRRRAKVINFGIIYGMGVNALRANLGTTRAEAQEFYDNYFQTFPRIKNYFHDIIEGARRNGYTETLFGRRRYLPALKSRMPMLRANAERMAMNAPIQGTAADLVKMAMSSVDKKLDEEKLNQQVYLLLQIHDELIYEAEESVVSRAKKIIKEAMENVCDLGLPLTVSEAVGERWGELK